MRNVGTRWREAEAAYYLVGTESLNVAGDRVAVRLFSPDREIHHGLRIAPMSSFDGHRRG